MAAPIRRGWVIDGDVVADDARVVGGDEEEGGRGGHLGEDRDGDRRAGLAEVAGDVFLADVEGVGAVGQDRGGRML